MVIGIITSIIYLVITIGVYFLTKEERKVWEELYEAVKSGKINIDI